jgi:hypothetical protein
MEEASSRRFLFPGARWKRCQCLRPSRWRIVQVLQQCGQSHRFGPGTARHRTAFVATLLALSRRDAEPLALAQIQCCAAGRIVTLPALAPISEGLGPLAAAEYLLVSNKPTNVGRELRKGI